MKDVISEEYLMRFFGHSYFSYSLLFKHFLSYYTEKRHYFLDAGCGAGRHTETMHRNVQTVGVDIDRVNLRLAKETGKRLSLDNQSFILADVEKLPFREKIFDVTLLCDVLEHLKSPEAAIREVSFALKNQGKLLIGTPNAKAPPVMISRVPPKQVFHHLQGVLGARWLESRFYKLNEVNILKQRSNQAGLIVENLLMTNWLYVFRKHFFLSRLLRIYDAITDRVKILNQEIVIIARKVK